MDQERYVISVLARDHVGIIADVADTLFSLGANIEALSQTVVGEWFTMIVRAMFPAGITADAVTEAIERKPDFRAMVAPCVAHEMPLTSQGEPYVCTTVGNDKPGIVRRFARCFADHGVNIEDVWNEIRDGKFVEIFHVTVPPVVDAKELREILEATALELGISLLFQHQDVFTATNSLSVHTQRRF